MSGHSFLPLVAKSLPAGWLAVRVRYSYSSLSVSQWSPDIGLGQVIILPIHSTTAVWALGMEKEEREERKRE